MDNLWMSARSLSADRGYHVPATAVFANEDVRLGLPPVLSSSTGTAAHDDVAAARRHAVLERVERDAVAIWWYNMMAVPRLGAAVVDAALPCDFAAWLRDRRRMTWHLLAGTDLPVPAVVALSSAPDGTRPAIGASAALDVRSAVRSATLELLQGEIALVHMRRAQELTDAPEPPSLLAWSEATNARAVPYLRGEGEAAPPSPCSFSDLVEAFDALGIDVGIVDLTRPEFGVPVVKAVSTTLRDWQPRFAPGRLYDVPVALGWRDRPLTEAELNPVPFVI